jgi:23S rRNA pseudouridine2605 synthase
MTNSGDLANRLMHPRYAVERTYEVRIQGVLGEAELERLRRGVEIGDGPAAFESIEACGGEGSNRWYRARLREGRNREVRRMFAAVDRRVNRLIRVQYGPIALPHGLAPGAWEELGSREIARLRDEPKPGTRTVPRVVRDRQSC